MKVSRISYLLSGLSLNDKLVLSRTSTDLEQFRETSLEYEITIPSADGLLFYAGSTGRE